MRRVYVDLSKPRLLIVGVSGLLGKTLASSLNGEFEIFGTYFRNQPKEFPNNIQLDATKDEELERLLNVVEPNIVLNCSGLTSVDECERRPEASWLLNCYIPAKISQLLSNTKTKFVQISTDHFESGDFSPRSELEKVWHVNQYGYSKLLAEEEVLIQSANNLVVRTNFFGLGKKNGNSLLDFAFNSLTSGKSVRGFADVEFSPVGVTFLSSVLATLLRENCSGILNVSSQEVINKYDFLLLVADILRIQSDFVSKGSSKDLNEFVLRPNYLALDPRKLIREHGVEIPSIEEMIRVEMGLK